MFIGRFDRFLRRLLELSGVLGSLPFLESTKRLRNVSVARVVFISLRAHEVSYEETEISSLLRILFVCFTNGKSLSYLFFRNFVHLSRNLVSSVQKEGFLANYKKEIVRRKGKYIT